MIEAPPHATAAIRGMIYSYKNYVDEGNFKHTDRCQFNTSDMQSTYPTNPYFDNNMMNLALSWKYATVELDIEEIKKIYQEFGAPLAAVQMAGDEVPHRTWEKSPAANNFSENYWPKSVRYQPTRRAGLNPHANKL